jgi:hypothetical protein
MADSWAELDKIHVMASSLFALAAFGKTFTAFTSLVTRPRRALSLMMTGQAEGQLRGTVRQMRCRM